MASKKDDLAKMDAAIGMAKAKEAKTNSKRPVNPKAPKPVVAKAAKPTKQSPEKVAKIAKETAKTAKPIKAKTPKPTAKPFVKTKETRESVAKKTKVSTEKPNPILQPKMEGGDPSAHADVKGSTRVGKRLKKAGKLHKSLSGAPESRESIISKAHKGAMALANPPSNPGFRTPGVGVQPAPKGPPTAKGAATIAAKKESVSKLKSENAKKRESDTFVGPLPAKPKPSAASSKDTRLPRSQADRKVEIPKEARVGDKPSATPRPLTKTKKAESLVGPPRPPGNQAKKQPPLIQGPPSLDESKRSSAARQAKDKRKARAQIAIADYQAVGERFAKGLPPKPVATPENREKPPSPSDVRIPRRKDGPARKQTISAEARVGDKPSATPRPLTKAKKAQSLVGPPRPTNEQEALRAKGKRDSIQGPPKPTAEQSKSIADRDSDPSQGPKYTPSKAQTRYDKFGAGANFEPNVRKTKTSESGAKVNPYSGRSGPEPQKREKPVYMDSVPSKTLKGAGQALRKGAGKVVRGAKKAAKVVGKALTSPTAGKIGRGAFGIAKAVATHVGMAAFHGVDYPKRMLEHNARGERNMKPGWHGFTVDKPQAYPEEHSEKNESTEADGTKTTKTHKWRT